MKGDNKMAAAKENLGLTEKIFKETNLRLAANFSERLRHLGDSTSKAGVETALAYLSGKSELAEEELEKLSVGQVPEDYERKHFEKYIARFNERLNKKEIEFCYDAFVSGISAALLYMVKTAKLKNIDLPSVIPSIS